MNAECSIWLISFLPPQLTPINNSKIFWLLMEEQGHSSSILFQFHSTLLMEWRERRRKQRKRKATIQLNSSSSSRAAGEESWSWLMDLPRSGAAWFLACRERLRVAFISSINWLHSINPFSLLRSLFYSFCFIHSFPSFCLLMFASFGGAHGAAAPITPTSSHQPKGSKVHELRSSAKTKPIK